MHFKFLFLLYNHCHLSKFPLVFLRFLLQTAMDQLHMHFTQAIHNTVFQVVLGYVELCAGNADTKFQKMQYKDLCTVLSILLALLSLALSLISLSLFHFFLALFLSFFFSLFM